MILDIDLLKLAICSIAFIVMFTVFYRSHEPGPFRRTCSFFLIFLFIYNGIGASDRAAPIWLIAAFLAFCFVFIASSKISFNIFRKIGDSIKMRDRGIQSIFLEGNAPLVIISLYILISISNLIFPEFKLLNLFNPPYPNLIDRFEYIVAGGADGGFIYYVKILVTPVFYISLIRYRKKPLVVVFLILFPIYIEYVKNSYVGRYDIGFGMAFIFLWIWDEFPRWRQTLVISTVTSIPILFTFFNIYAKLRLGVSLDSAILATDDGFFSGFENVFQSETSFLQVSGLRIIESDIRADIISYFTWMITLPLPGFLKGGLNLSYVNYEISESILNISRYSRGFYVKLPGVLAESFYIYGNIFFLIHAIHFGLMAGFLGQILGRARSLAFLSNYFVLAFGLVLNRGGIAAFLPYLANGLILFYMVIALLLFRRIPDSRTAYRG